MSNVVIKENSIDSLERIFEASGNQIFGVALAFRRVSTIPEPSFTLAFISITTLGINSAIQGKIKKS